MKYLITTIFLLLPGTVFADTSVELVTDRPDQTESALVVPPGSIQLETGATFTRADSDYLQFPSTLTRIGLTERLELRLGVGGWTWTDESDAMGNDAEIGSKVRLWDEAGARPEAALLLGTTIPLGDEENSENGLAPSFRLSFAHTLTELLSLGYNVGAAWSRYEDAPEKPTFQIVRDLPTAAWNLVMVQNEPDVDLLATCEYTTALGIGITERLGAFFEVFGEAPLNAPGKPAHSFDGGFTYLIRPSVQFDIAGGVGLNDAADDWFVGAGISVRLQK